MLMLSRIVISFPSRSSELDKLVVLFSSLTPSLNSAILLSRVGTSQLFLCFHREIRVVKDWILGGEEGARGKGKEETIAIVDEDSPKVLIKGIVCSCCNWIPCSLRGRLRGLIPMTFVKDEREGQEADSHLEIPRKTPAMASVEIESMVSFSFMTYALSRETANTKFGEHGVPI